jgi:hypothetical protein
MSLTPNFLARDLNFFRPGKWKSLLKGAGLKSEKSVSDPKLFGGIFESFFDSIYIQNYETSGSSDTNSAINPVLFYGPLILKP